jgi:lipoprotein NlpI
MITRTAVVFLCLALPALSAAGDSVEEQLKAARAALERGEPKAALELAEKAIRSAPKNPNGHYLLGLAQEELGNYREAVASFTKVLALDPKAARAYNQRGGAHFKLGEFAKSVADFDKYLEVRPEQKNGHWRRGISCYYAKQFDEGRKQFEGYEQVDTNDVENAVWRYLCMAPVVGVEKARAAMLKIGKDRRVPMMEVYDLFRGRLKPADVLAAAKADVPLAEQLNRHLFYAHLYLGLYYDSLGDSKRALEHLTTAQGHRIAHYMWDVARVHAELLRHKKGG